MSILQEQAVQMISELSDDNVSFLIEVIQLLMPRETYLRDIEETDNKESMQALQRLEMARKEILQYIPKEFDPDKELEEARSERYGSID